MDDTGQDLPVGPAVIKSEGQLLQMVEKILPHIVDDVLPDSRHQPGADGIHGNAQRNGQHRRNGEQP